MLLLGDHMAAVWGSQRWLRKCGGFQTAEPTVACVFATRLRALSERYQGPNSPMACFGSVPIRACVWDKGVERDLPVS